MTLTSDVIIIGGGVVGAALAVGCLRTGASVHVLDGDDADLRAARANFGLIWVQSKGHEMPAYARWTRQSADLWPAFADELNAGTGQNLALRQTGGLSFCVGEEALEAKRLSIARLHNQREPWSADVRIVERRELEAMLPGVQLGRDVAGASFCPQDGECDPLAMLVALHSQIQSAGGGFHSGAKASAITRVGDVFRVTTAKGVFEAPRLLLAAGHGARELAASVGLHAPIQPQRGQIIVTERIAPFLPFAGDAIRQTADGTVMLGATHEDVGFNLNTTVSGGAAVAADALKVFPDLASAGIVRTWSGLRVLTPDGCPLYAESETHPGAALITCHSGVTLAAAHARVLAPALMQGRLGAEFAAFGVGRFVNAVIPGERSEGRESTL
ncbi:MAG: NAD(P)/FAD-dependent oxidoreductase [Beijerinckiaceae bacterium]